MEFPEKVCKWRFKNNNNLISEVESEAAEFSGEFVFGWPYRWVTDLDKFQPLIYQQALDVLKYSTRRITWPDGFDSLPLIKDSVWMSTFCTSWAEEAQQNLRVYRKLLLFNVYFYCLFVIDDVCEKLAGHPRHADFVRSLGRLLQKMYLLEFESIENIEQDQQFLNLKEIVRFEVGIIFVFFDVVNDMESEFHVTAKTSTCLARALREEFELQTWFGSANNSHYLDLELRNELRSRNVGFNPPFEFVLMLDGIHPTENIRHNFYFNRLLQSARTLAYLINDTLSVLKELQEARETGKRIDNIILITMETQNITFQQALKSTIQKHNKKVQEFGNEVEYLLSDEQFLIDLNHEEKKLFWKTIEYGGIIISCIIQTHLKMSRYKNQVLYDFVNIE